MNDSARFLQRVSVVGCSGSGKTTLGRSLARRLAVPAIDLDDLYWLPDWKSREEADFRILLRRVLQGGSWVVSGNYSRVRPEIWARAQAVIWLDYSFPVVMGRLMRRTFRRSLSGEPCCNGNRETLRLAFSSDSVILWGLKTYARRRRDYPGLLAHPDCAHLQIFHFRSPHQTSDWLARL